jgi:hypothetical protein
MGQHAVIGQVYQFDGQPVTAVRYVTGKGNPGNPCYFCAVWRTKDVAARQLQCDSMPSCMPNDVVFLAAERADEYSAARAAQIAKKLIGEAE